MPRIACAKCLETPASTAPTDHKDHQELSDAQDHVGCEDRADNLDDQVAMDSQEHQESWEALARPDVMVVLDQPDHKDKTVARSSELQDRRDHAGRVEPRGQPDQPETTPMLASKDQRARRVVQDSRDHKDRRETADVQEMLASRARTLNTAHAQIVDRFRYSTQSIIILVDCSFNPTNKRNNFDNLLLFLKI